VTGGQASCDTMIPGDTIFFLIRMGLTAIESTGNDECGLVSS
jgi:hypothetical protein